MSLFMQKCIVALAVLIVILVLCVPGFLTSPEIAFVLFVVWPIVLIKLAAFVFSKVRLKGAITDRVSGMVLNALISMMLLVVYFALILLYGYFHVKYLAPETWGFEFFFVWIPEIMICVLFYGFSATKRVRGK